MTRKAISLYMAATCAIAIVAPGRLVCGLIIAVELQFLMLFGLLFKAFLRKIKLDNLAQPLMLCFAVYFTIMFKQLLTLIMPELALQLSFVLYLPTISTFTTVFLLEETPMTLKESMKKDLPVSFHFEVYIIMVSFLRDVLGYGTLTLPFADSQLEYVLFSSERISATSFLATIPGSLVLNALLLSLYLFIEKKGAILKKAGLLK